MTKDEMLDAINTLGQFDHINYPSSDVIKLRNETARLHKISEAATHAVKARREYLAALNNNERSTAAEDYVHEKANQWTQAWARLAQACYPRT